MRPAFRPLFRPLLSKLFSADRQGRLRHGTGHRASHFSFSIPSFTHNIQIKLRVATYCGGEFKPYKQRSMKITMLLLLSFVAVSCSNGSVQFSGITSIEGKLINCNIHYVSAIINNKYDTNLYNESITCICNDFLKNHIDSIVGYEKSSLADILHAAEQNNAKYAVILEIIDISASLRSYPKSKQHIKIYFYEIKSMKSTYEVNLSDTDYNIFLSKDFLSDGMKMKISDALFQYCELYFRNML